MKKKLTLLFILIATFCVTLACAVMVACNPDEEDNTDYGDPATDGYIVTLLYPDGSPVKNTDGDSPLDIPSVELTDENGDIVDEAAYSTVNASGVAVMNYFVPGEYYIKVTDYPSGYMFDNFAIKTSADRARYTVSLFPAAPAKYTVNVTYPNGTPMQGVTVKFMNGGTTVATATTDNNGAATTAQELERFNYTVALENLPQGYIYKSATTPLSAAPLTVTTLSATAVTFDDSHKLNVETVKPWDDALNSYTGVSVIRFDVTGDNYAYRARFGANEEVFFTVKAPKTGEYIIGSKKGNNYVIQFYSNDLSYVDDSLTISSAENNGNNVRGMHIEKDETLTFSVKSANRAAGVVDVLICMPVPAPNTVTATEVGEYNLPFENFNTAILKFVTSNTAGQGFGQGKYRITSASEQYDVMLVEYVNSYPTPDPDSDLKGEYEGLAGDDNSAGDGKNFVYNTSFSQSYVGVTVYFHIIIKDTNITYPTLIKVKIERLGDADEEMQITKKTATTNVDTKYADQEGTFTWAPVDGSLVPYEKGGKWYVEVGGVEKALVVAIKKELNGQEYSFSNVEYMGDSSGKGDDKGDGRLNTYLTVYENTETRDTTWNYTDFIAQYAKFVNKDGVYEVNAELKLFLERYMNQRFSDITDSSVKPAYPWLLGCGNYA